MMMASEVPMHSGIRTSSGHAGEAESTRKIPAPGMAPAADAENAGEEA